MNFKSFAAEDESDDEAAVAGGLNSDRLFFEPAAAGETSSILRQKPVDFDFPYKDTTTIIEVNSSDPRRHFGASMEEMVAAHGIKDWDALEELLGCYLRVNAKSNHGYIISAFVDVWIRIGSIFGPGSGSPSFDSSSVFTSSGLSSSLERGGGGGGGALVLEKSECSCCSDV